MEKRVRGSNTVLFGKGLVQPCLTAFAAGLCPDPFIIGSAVWRSALPVKTESLYVSAKKKYDGTYYFIASVL